MKMHMPNSLCFDYKGIEKQMPGLQKEHTGQMRPLSLT